MADRSQRLAIIVTAQDLASGKLGKVRSELAQMGRGGQIAAIGLGTGIKTIRTLEGAASHLGHRIGSLAGPLGFVGLTGAVFGVSGALEQGIEKAQTMGFAVEKLTGLTGASAESASTLLAVFEKFGVDADRTNQIVGFTEKTLGKLTIESGKAGKGANQLAAAHTSVMKATEKLHIARLKLIETERKGHVSASQLATAQARVSDAEAALTAAHNKLAAAQTGANDPTTKAEALQKRYGIALLDATGKALPFEKVLGNVADYYNSNASASDKAYVAATVFGRGYAQLIPILKLGASGIADAEQAAKDFGLVLTAQNAEDLAKYREAVREAGDAVSGLELQLGLMVIPDLTSALKAASDWARNHRGDIEGFFRGALDTAKTVVGFVTGSLIPTVQGLASTAKGFWDSIPGPLRDIIVKGFIADRTINFLFGLSPGKLVFSLAGDVAGPIVSRLIGGLAGGIFARGATPASPMFVADVTGGLGGGAANLIGGGKATLASMLLKGLVGGLVAAGGSMLLGSALKQGVDPGAIGGAIGGAGAMIGGGALAFGPIGAIVGSIAAVVQTQQTISQQSTDQATKVHGDLTNLIATQPDRAKLQQALDGVNKGINDIQANPLNVLVSGDALDQLKAMRDDLRSKLAITGGGDFGDRIGKATDDAGRGLQVMTGTAEHAGKVLDDLGGSAMSLAGIFARELRILGTKGGAGGYQGKSNQFRFIGANANQNGLDVAEAVVAKFEHSQSPFYRDSKNAARGITALEREQKGFIARGDTKNAAIVGGYIARMKAEVHEHKLVAQRAKNEARSSADREANRISAVTRAISAQSIAFTVMNNIRINTSISGRDAVHEQIVQETRTHGASNRSTGVI